MLSEKSKAAIAGAALCGLIGPGTALLLLEVEAFRPSSLRETAAIIMVVLKGWFFAFATVGPAAFVLGAIGGLLPRRLVRKHHSMKVVLVPTAVLGLALGIAAPLVVMIIGGIFGPRDGSYSSQKEAVGVLPVAALTGVICAFLLLWLFHSTRLLYSSGESHS